MMFLDDIELVKHVAEVWGPLQQPWVDLGGLENPTVAEFKDGWAKLGQMRRPWDILMPGYIILNPAYGHPPIEELPKTYKEHFGTIICTSTLEHVQNPIRVVQAMNEIAKPGAIIVISTVFCYPYHNAPQDYWRFTQECMKMLAELAYLKALEVGRRISVTVDGLRDHPVDIRSVHLVAQK